EYVGLDALLPVAFEDRHVFEGGGMKNQIRFRLADQREHSIAIADIGDAAIDHRCTRFSRKAFENGVQRRLRILNNQQPSGAKIDDSIANLGSDRTAAAGDNNRLAANEMLKPS